MKGRQGSHKVGKFSTPIHRTKQPKNAPFLNSNGGHSQRSNETAQFHSLADKRQAPKPSSNGAAPDITKHG